MPARVSPNFDDLFTGLPDDYPEDHRWGVLTEADRRTIDREIATDDAEEFIKEYRARRGRPDPRDIGWGDPVLRFYPGDK